MVSEMKFYKTPAPHSVGHNQVSVMMLTVMLALIPGMLIQTWFFGWGVIINVIWAMMIAAGTEALILKWRDRPIVPTLLDGSALVTGMLLGLAVPSIAPWWITFTAVTFAIVFAKHIYGGLGYNPFNPAMVGYVLVLISFPLQMTAWLPPKELLSHPFGFMDSLSMIFSGHTIAGFDATTLRTGIDGFTLATPLDKLKTDLGAGFMTSESMQNEIFGNFAGKGWGLVNLGYLFGGLFLIGRKVIGWQIPVAMLATIFILSVLFNMITPNGYTPTMIQLFSGATMLGAFFIATDPVSAATSPRGRLYFGIGIGILIYIIREFGGYPDAVAFAVLLMNLAAPTIDHFTVPVSYGHRKTVEPIEEGDNV